MCTIIMGAILQGTDFFEKMHEGTDFWGPCTDHKSDENNIICPQKKNTSVLQKF